jgi:hypothetical protein
MGAKRPKKNTTATANDILLISPPLKNNIYSLVTNIRFFNRQNHVEEGETSEIGLLAI